MDDHFIKIDRRGVTLGPIKSLDQITCVKVSELATPAGGSTYGTCHDCQSDVWMSPESGALAKRFPNALVLCVQCSLDRLEGGVH